MTGKLNTAIQALVGKKEKCTAECGLKVDGIIGHLVAYQRLLRALDEARDDATSNAEHDAWIEARRAENEAADHFVMETTKAFVEAVGAFDPAKPVRTRDGQSARILATDSKVMVGGVPFPIVAESQHGDGVWTVSQYCSDGHYLPAGRRCALDLVNIPTSVTGWVNVFGFDSGGQRWVGGIYATEKAARGAKVRLASPSRYIATVPITWEE